MLPNNTLPSICIENSSLCGARCIMCPRDKVDYFKAQMPMDLFKKTVDEAAAMGMSQFSMCALGDPLMDTNLEERMQFVKENYPSLEVSITTTGHLLNDAMADLVCRYMKPIKISNYGFSKETYQKVHRGALKYEQVISNIETYLRRPDRPYTIMTFCILPENQHEKEAWKDYWEPKVDRIDIWLPHNWGGFYSPPPNNPTTPQSGEEIVKPCQRVMDLDDLVVRADGRVNVCCFNVHNDQVIIGDIKTETLRDIVNNEKVNELQRIHREGLVMSTDLPCKKCDQIRDRNFALVYTSDFRMQVGKYSLYA